MNETGTGMVVSASLPFRFGGNILVCVLFFFFFPCSPRDKKLPNII